MVTGGATGLGAAIVKDSLTMGLWLPAVTAKVKIRPESSRKA